jgi:hypothetical protein
VTSLPGVLPSTASPTAVEAVQKNAAQHKNIHALEKNK